MSARALRPDQHDTHPHDKSLPEFHAYYTEGLRSINWMRNFARQNDDETSIQLLRLAEKQLDELRAAYMAYFVRKLDELVMFIQNDPERAHFMSKYLEDTLSDLDSDD